MSLNRQKLEQFSANLIHHSQLSSISLHLYDTLASTNQTAWELIEQGIKPPFVVIANQQTAGRGQWGRQWLSHWGGLYLSLALLPHLNTTQAYHLVFLSAWGVAQRLRDYQIPVFLKWPNDLVLLGRKLGGIKSETKSHKDRITHAVIGIGLNWNNPTPQVGINLQSFWEDSYSASIESLEMLAALTVDGLLYGYQYYQTYGIEKLISAYQELFYNQGQTIAINECTGVIVGITASGELKVRLQSPGATTEIALPIGIISLGYNQ